MKTKLLFILSAIVLLNTPCFASSPTRIPVEDYSHRISSTGLSLLPPQEENWFFLKDLPQGGCVFGKNDPAGTETFICSLTVVPANKQFKTLDEFLKFVKEKQENAGRGRFVDLKSEYNPNTRFALYCVEYVLSATDTKRKNKDKLPLILKIKGFMFVYPEAPDFIVDINYSERGTNKEFTPSFKVLGEKFIDNIRIEPEDKINFADQLYENLVHTYSVELLLQSAMNTYKEKGNELCIAEVYRTYAYFISSKAVEKNKKYYRNNGFILDKDLTFENRIQKTREYLEMSKNLYEKNGKYDYHPNIYYNLGRLYYIEKNKEKALEAFNKSLKYFLELHKDKPDIDVSPEPGYMSYNELIADAIKQVERLK